MNQELYEKAVSIQAEAQSMLDKSSILEILGLYGQVHYYGSFAFGTMYNRDIDILLKINDSITGDKRDVVQEITEKLFKLKQEIIDIHFIDCFNFKIKEKLPKGFYLGFDMADNAIVETWHFDIWLLSSEDFNKNMSFVRNVKQMITTELKKLVMNVKFELVKRNQIINLAISYKIYRAVFIEELRDIKKIFNYIGINY